MWVLRSLSAFTCAVISSIHMGIPPRRKSTSQRSTTLWNLPDLVYSTHCSRSVLEDATKRGILSTFSSHCGSISDIVGAFLQHRGSDLAIRLSTACADFVNIRISFGRQRMLSSFQQGSRMLYENSPTEVGSLCCNRVWLSELSIHGAYQRQSSIGNMLSHKSSDAFT